MENIRCCLHQSDISLCYPPGDIPSWYRLHVFRDINVRSWKGRCHHACQRRNFSMFYYDTRKYLRGKGFSSGFACIFRELIFPAKRAPYKILVWEQNERLMKSDVMSGRDREDGLKNRKGNIINWNRLENEQHGDRKTKKYRTSDSLHLAHIQQLLWVSASIFFFDLVTIFARFFWIHFFSLAQNIWR